MELKELCEVFVELAREAGLEVRRVSGRSGADGDDPPASGICRVRGATWVVLSAADPPEDQIAVLARALGRCAPEWLEGRYLPPAVRERLEGQEDLEEQEESG